jgi:hypothetical protein
MCTTRAQKKGFRGGRGAAPRPPTGIVSLALRLLLFKLFFDISMFFQPETVAFDVDDLAMM